MTGNILLKRVLLSKKLLFLLFFFITTFIMSGVKASAIDNIFPDPADFTPAGQEVYAVVATANGTSYLLDAPSSAVRLYVPANYNQPIRVTVVDPKNNGGPNAGNQNAVFNVWGYNDSADSYYFIDSRNGALNTANFTFVFPNNARVSSKYPGYKIYEIEALAGAGFGWNSFKLVSNVGNITYFSQSIYDKFALKAVNNTGYKNFRLTFGTPCDQTTPTVRNLRFFDADAGQPNQNYRNPVVTSLSGSTNASMNIYDNPRPGNPQQVGGGGQGERGRFSVSINPGNLVWTWQDIWEDNGIQFGLPFDAFDRKFRDLGGCREPVVGSACTITSNIANGRTDVPLNSSLNISAHSTNNPPVPPGVTWDNSYLVYFHVGVASTGSEPPRIHKYGTVADPNGPGAPPGGQADADNIVLSPGQSSPEVDRTKTGQTLSSFIDMSTPGRKQLTLTLNHIVSLTPITWQSIGSCTLSFTVVAPPVVPVVEFIGSQGCQNTSFRIGWSDGVTTTPINVVFSLNPTGDSTSLVLPPGDYSRSTFNVLFPNAPLHLSSYTIQMTAGGSSASDVSNIFGGCLTLTCGSNSTHEFGNPNPFILSFNINNATSKTNDVRYRVNVPGINMSNGAINPGANQFVSIDYRPVVGGTINGELYFNSAQPTGIQSIPGCTFAVVRFPYVKAYNSDVSVGGSFGSACTPTTSGIFTRMRQGNQHVPGASPNQNKSGSGGQLAALAWGSSFNITGFATAEMMPAHASAIKHLAFGGNPTMPLDSQLATVGGGLNGTPPCITDYYNETQYRAGSPLRVNGTSGSINQGGANNNEDGKQIFYTGDTTVDINGNYSGRRTFYIDGDVFIARNVAYNSSFSNINQIPNFTLVVKGNIYISSTVNRLDGIYIAQPNDTDPANTGRIYTCATSMGSAPTDPAGVYSSCSGGYGAAGTTPQLVVNGSFIAQKVILNRAVNTLADSTFRESPSSSRAAEIFNFSPEIYLSPPIFRSSDADYDSMAILPPIL